MPETREVLLQKRKELQERLMDMEEEEKRILREIDKVDEQIRYYRALVKDMKSELSPPLFTRLMDALR